MWCVLQCVCGVCCSVYVVCVAVCYFKFRATAYKACVAVVLQCAVVCCSALQCVAVCCSVLQCAISNFAQQHIRRVLQGVISQKSVPS